MRAARRCLLIVMALAALLVAPLGMGAAHASPAVGAAGGFGLKAWTDLPQGTAAPSALAADESYCIPVAGPGIKMTFYCDIKQPSTLWVYCTGVTVEIRLEVGRWAPSGSCPGYRGYQLVPRL
ncbi:hypothetical protein Sru01_03000 [Sphaerisporangium rufum]|uniref:Uncharacterized protein n=1 Tax=Sphaerisporangium rufum TaxID=1381558 RepID=A0A919QWU5_9ACTN|nr:hypothetical protein [Sphaerisporangium rufum]GII75318.1 hypothetical protein Sru01_03000 [Sphaerisporangium rufum]